MKHLTIFILIYLFFGKWTFAQYDNSDFLRRHKQEFNASLLSELKINNYNLLSYKIIDNDSVRLDQVIICKFNKQGQLINYEVTGFGGYIDSIYYEHNQIKKVTQTSLLSKSIELFYYKNSLLVKTVKKETRTHLDISRPKTNYCEINKYKFKEGRLTNYYTKGNGNRIKCSLTYKPDTLIETTIYYRKPYQHWYVFDNDNLIKSWLADPLNIFPDNLILYDYNIKNQLKSITEREKITTYFYKQNGLIDYIEYKTNDNREIIVVKYLYNVID